jgi:hypothetical protein
MKAKDGWRQRNRNTRCSTKVTATGRVCTKCRRFKLWELFPIDLANTYGHRPCCKRCAAKASAKWKKETDYYNTNRTTILKYKKATYNPVKKKAYDLLNKYGITLHEFRAMLKRQKYACKLCRRRLVSLAKTRTNEAVVDHCHKTNTVRGLLCHSCNRALGLLKDNPRLLLRAAKYVR